MPKFNYAAAAGAGSCAKARRALDKALDDVLDDACDALSGVFESAVQTALEGARRGPGRHERHRRPGRLRARRPQAEGRHAQTPKRQALGGP